MTKYAKNTKNIKAHKCQKRTFFHQHELTFTEFNNTCHKLATPIKCIQWRHTTITLN